MTALVWNRFEDRDYQFGVDRGVLYLPDGRAVPWNGLVSVNEDSGQGNTTPLYVDGIKVNDDQTTNDYSATMNAYTYPEEFEQFDGVVELSQGVLIDGQFPAQFNLSYRTRTAFGYKIHLLYNLTAVVSSKTYNSYSTTATPMTLSWSITGVPVEVDGIRPTEHFIIDTTQLTPGLPDLLESILYGSQHMNAMLPPIQQLIDIAVDWDPQIITPQPDGIALLIPGLGDLNHNSIPGFFTATPGSRLTPSDVDGIYTLE